MGDIHACRHAPPSKRVEIRERNYSSVEMVQVLVRQWEPEVAMMLAEWLEGQGFPGWAQKLRRKSFDTWDMVRVIDDLAGGMGLTTPLLRGVDRTKWKRRHKTTPKRSTSR